MARSTPAHHRIVARRSEPPPARTPWRRPVAKAAPQRRPPAADDGEVRIGPVAAIPEVLRKFGVVPSGPFARAGVPLQTFRNPDNRIAFEALGRLLAESRHGHGLRSLRPAGRRALRAGRPRCHRLPDAQLRHRRRGAAGPAAASVPARSRRRADPDQPGRVVRAAGLLDLSTRDARHRRIFTTPPSPSGTGC